MNNSNYECPNWINDNPTTKAIRNIFEAGMTDGLFKSFVFTGNPDICERCMKEFSEMLEAFGVSPEKIHTSYVYEGNSEYCLFGPESKANAPDEANIIDVSGITFADSRIKGLVKKLGLSTSYDALKDYLKDYPGWEGIKESVFINNTLLTHYRRSVDKTLSPEDLDWLNGMLKKKEKGEPAQSNQVSEPTATGKTELDETTKEEKIPDKTEEQQDNETHEDSKDDLSHEGVSGNPDVASAVDSTDQNKTMPGTEEAPEYKPAETDTALTEAPIQEQEYTIEEKKAIAASNKELDRQMYQVYQETIAFLKSQHDVRWNEFIEQYKAAIANGDYSVRVCKKYLEMTQQNSKGPVYAALYKADVATKGYQKSIKRIMEPSRCFSCGETFMADLTFAKSAEWRTVCPKCNAPVIKTIDWLS